jgi:hypothetical protein
MLFITLLMGSHVWVPAVHMRKDGTVCWRSRRRLHGVWLGAAMPVPQQHACRLAASAQHLLLSCTCHMPTTCCICQNALQDDQEEFEIDLNDDEPEFLKGHSSRSGIEMSPIKIVKNPEGSMQRAAMTAVSTLLQCCRVSC